MDESLEFQSTQILREISTKQIFFYQYVLYDIRYGTYIRQEANYLEEFIFIKTIA